MTTASYSSAQVPDPSPLAPLLDEQRLGSAGGQAASGIAAIVLTIVLVMGQVSLATSKGINENLEEILAHITEGNEVMEQVAERAAPTVELERLLKVQGQTLSQARDSLAMTNADLASLSKTTTQLDRSVIGMQQTSTQLASDVKAVDSTTGSIASSLEPLPAATDRTRKQLVAIGTDTSAINGELGAITGKMQRYGVPQAVGAPTGSSAP